MRGVVYSQFGSKADMFFALLERRIEERAAQSEQIATGLAGMEAMHDPELNRRYAAIPDHDVAQPIPRALGLGGTEDPRL
jgi:AcrR family transcriptional regulator